MIRILGMLLALAALGGNAMGQSITATVPGDRLGWESDELNVVISLLEPSYVKLEVYSPAFDPDDYRASLEGRPELGDERYDGGDGSVGSTFSLARNGSLILRRDFGVAPHGSEVLFAGQLGAGEYTLSSSFQGLGKNTFVYSLTTDPAAAIYFGANETMLFNVRGHEPQEVLTVVLDDEHAPATFQLYDGDGDTELRGRLDTPSGPIQIPISGDLEWTTIRLGQPGTYTFSFYQPEGAYQHSNTIGIRSSERLRSTPSGLRFTRIAPVDVRIVDPAGINLPGTYEIKTEGQQRTAVLTGLPDDYRLVDTLTQGGAVQSPQRVRFGSEGGSVTFVAERLPAPPSTLTVSATLRYGQHVSPYPLAYSLDGVSDTLPASGTLTTDVTPGVHTFRVPRIPGATVSGPAAVIVQQGQHATVEYVVTPQVDLALTVDVDTRWRDELFQFTATATTLFQRPLPGVIGLTLPAGLTPLAEASLQGQLSAQQPLVLSLPAVGSLSGSHLVEARLAPWELAARVQVQVLEPASEPAPEPQPATEAPQPPSTEPAPAPVAPPPAPEPPVEEPLPAVEPPAPTVAPDFEASRRSTVHLEFQAGRVQLCQLASLAPGASTTLGLALLVTDPELYAEPRLRPQASPADSLEVYLSSVSRQDDGVQLRLEVRNLSDQPVTGSVLVPLPLGTRAAADANCNDAGQAAERLLLGHPLPQGGTYVPGSATLDGLGYADPDVAYVEGQGETLIWSLPWREAGTLSYELLHTAALPPLAEPSLTTLFAERQQPLVGSLDSQVLSPQAATLAAEELAGAGTSVGPVTDIAFRPVQLVADGRNPLVVDVVLLNEAGAPTGNGLLSVAASSEPWDQDADPVTSGHQVQVVGGHARVRLAPATTPMALTLGVLALTDDGRLLAEETLEVLGTRTGLYQAQISVTALLAQPTELHGFGRGYLELPLGAHGTLQAAVDVGAAGGGLQSDRSLTDDPRDADRYPLTGAGTEAAPTLGSSDGFAVLYTAPGVTAGYYEARAQVPGVLGLPNLTGLHAAVELGGGFQLRGYAALVPGGAREQVFRGDGTRRYGLGEGVRRGSESVSLVVGHTERGLTRNVDYVIDDYLGAITLLTPLPAYDTDLNPVSLRVVYAPATQARDAIAGGFGVSYRAPSLTLQLGAAMGDGTRVGAAADYQGQRLDASVAYQAELGDATQVTGSAQVGYDLTPQDRLTLRHVTAADNTTTLRYSHRFDLAADRALTLSGGLAHVWEEGLLSAVAGADLRAGELTLAAAHEQPLSAAGSGVTGASVAYGITPNLTAKLSAEYTWGSQLTSVIGLQQRVGDTELSLSYQLPTADGAGNRARFGVRAPFGLTPYLSLDLHGGIDGSLSQGDLNGSAGAALRYRTAELVATLGGELAYTDGLFKVVLRTGAAGQLGVDQNIAFDANYQVVPELQGRLSLAYSLKRGPLNFLTYHRMINQASGAVLEGEVAPTINLANRLQLRPNVAYRALLDDPSGNAYQGSLFAVGYLEPTLGEWRTTLGLGLGGHVLWMPGQDAVDYGASAELQARLIDEVWLGVGYTFGGFQGLTSETRGGLYLKLDLAAGGQY